MKISFIIELLLIFGIIAFAAGHVASPRGPKIIQASHVSKQNEDNTIELEISNHDDDDEVEATEAPELLANEVEAAVVNPANTTVNVDDSPPINKYCTCSNAICNCCREFSLPIVPVRGPGCATIQYLDNDRLSISLKYGDLVLASRKVSAGKSKPICLPFPGGFTRFCGRIYGVQRVEDEFKACLGLELRAEEEVEAALRISCFKFGEKGLAVTDADPLPPVSTQEPEDDDDFFGLIGGGGGDDSDDDDDDDDDDDSAAGGADDDEGGFFGLGGSDDDDDDDDDSASSDDSPDYTGFSLIGEEVLDGLFGDDDDKKKPVKPIKPVAIKAKNTKSKIAAAKNATVEVEKDTPDTAEDSNEIIAPQKPTKSPPKPTKKQKPSTSGGILDALLGGDDEGDAEADYEYDEADLTEDEPEEEEAADDADDTEDEKDTEADDEEEEEEDEDTEADYEEEAESIGDEDAETILNAITGTKSPTKIPKKTDKNTNTKKKKVKNDYGFGLFSRLFKFF